MVWNGNHGPVKNRQQSEAFKTAKYQQYAISAQRRRESITPVSFPYEAFSMPISCAWRSQQAGGNRSSLMLLRKQEHM
ncbi:hypothetical protein BTHE_1487 [Bifidobacterium thermophilum]|nr:hypothetical protein BTHE_1487 [Bifidobacterium thermophilum]